jgi:hypothetical protein
MNAVRFDLSPPSTQEIHTRLADKKPGDLESRYELHSLPLYAVETLPALMQKIRATAQGSQKIEQE